MTLSRWSRIILACLAICALAGCTSQRIAISEKFGKAGRKE